MSLRVKALHVLLALGILLSQQAAMLHGISHSGELARQFLARGSPADALRTDDADWDQQLCVQCLAFAQVASVAPSEPISIALPGGSDPEVRFPVQPQLGAASAVPFLARAPPPIA